MKLFGTKIFWIKKDDALLKISKFNAIDIPCSVSYLPIESYTANEAQSTIDTYVDLIKKIAEINRLSPFANKKKNDITLKLYQFWQYIYDDKEFYSKLLEIFNTAKKYNIFIWIDTSDRTLYSNQNIIVETFTIYQLAKNDWYDVGLCISSNIKIFSELAEELINKHDSTKHSIRLVKWFYNNYDKNSRYEISKDYLILTHMLVTNESISLLAIATHDTHILWHIIGKYKNTEYIKKIEFQHFCDINDNQIISLSKKYNTRIYVPYWKTPIFLVRGFAYFDKRRWFLRLLKLPLYSEWLFHLSEFLKNPFWIGGPWRVWNASIDTILNQMPNNTNIKILELWWWVGNISKRLASKSKFDLDVCEQNADFITSLKAIWGLRIFNGSFEDVNFEDQYDVIVSTIPMSTINKQKRQDILSKAYRLLKKDGQYIHLQYSNFIKNQIKDQFWNCNSIYCFKDFPFTCTMVARKAQE